MWRELIAAYPDAKVLLTLHPGGPEAWYESTWETIYYGERLWHWRVLERVIPVAGRFNQMVREVIWKRCLRGTMNDRTSAIARYLENLEQVKAAVPADQLLVFQVDQGWQPLCDFLGVPVPNTDFPRVNERKKLKRVMMVITGLAYLILLVAALALAAAVAVIVELAS